MARETFQTRLKRAMESAGLKQVDLVRIAAERGAKLGKSQVSQYVSGKVTPRRDVMELLAGVLGVTPQWLMGATDAMPDDVAPADATAETAAPQAPSTSRQKTTDQGSVTMREFKKSNKLDNVLYDVRGPVVDEAARMEEDGARILKLNIGNPAPFGFRAPDEVVYDMRQQLTDCEGYSDSRGLFAARKAIMQYAQLRNIPNVDMKHIYTGNGVSELIQLSMHALVDDGDEVLIPSPDYPLWTACVTLAGGHAVHYVCDEQNEWNPDLADMESKVTSRTKAIVVINPNNPTGAVYSKEVLEGIVEIARKHQLMIFADEIYDRLIMDGYQHISIASLAPDLPCVTFSGLSKSHMICGYRVGWMVLSGNQRCMRDFIYGVNMLSNMRLCSNVPAQSIVQTALGGYQSVNEYIRPGGRASTSSATTSTRRSTPSTALRLSSPRRPSTSSPRWTSSSTSRTTSSLPSTCCTRRRSSSPAAAASTGVSPTTSALSTCRAWRCSGVHGGPRGLLRALSPVAGRPGSRSHRSSQAASPSAGASRTCNGGAATFFLHVGLRPRSVAGVRIAALLCARTLSTCGLVSAT